MLSEPLASTMTLQQLADYVDRCDENSNEDFLMLAQQLAKKSREISQHLKTIRDFADNIRTSL